MSFESDGNEKFNINNISTYYIRQFRCVKQSGKRR